jgi:hypothetical protein
MNKRCCRGKETRCTAVTGRKSGLFSLARKDAPVAVNTQARKRKKPERIFASQAFVSFAVRRAFCA